MNKYIICSLSALLSIIPLSASCQNESTVREQLEKLNSYWIGKDLQSPVLQEKIRLNDDVSLIQMHLSLVEQTLREKNTHYLTKEQRENRGNTLDILHEYWHNGIFPINTGHKERTPYFIDHFGTACAVGQLIIKTGFEDVAEKIRAENNFAYIRDLNPEYPELKAWADAYGFKMEELAWIQPGYCFNPCPGTVRNVSCYEGWDGCIGVTPDMTGLGTPPYSYGIEQHWDGSQWVPWDGFCNIPAGLYRQVVVDAVYDSFYFEHTITQPDSISITSSTVVDDGSCKGAIMVNVTGGTPPYYFQWSNGDSLSTIANLCAGDYDLTVNDFNNCTKATGITVSLQTATLTHGPIIGGVTPTTARAFVRTSEATSFTLEVSSNQFQTIQATASDNTQPVDDFSKIVNITGLQPNTKYWVRTSIGGTPSGPASSFKTFPNEGEPGNYKLLFGSCIYELSDTDSALFKQMITEDANIFTPTGDWGYPDRSTGANDLYFSNPPKSWAEDYIKVRDIYKERYTSSNSSFFYRSIAMDYTHDDHDYLNDNSGRHHANIFSLNLASFGEPVSVPQPPQARLNILKGYQELFPHYPLVDPSEGIFHSYMLGNCEVFVLDLRSARTSQHEAIKEVNGKWVLQEPAGHTIMGQVQRDWLFHGLTNSTADWKIIVSSVVFNKGYKAAMDSLLRIGKGQSPILGFDLNGTQISTGLIGVGIISDSWVGFPSDQDALLQHIESHNIKNVVMVSGDAHTAALDDGANSGIPELLSANLKKANSEDAVIFSDFLGYWVWNRGGSGVGNLNFNNTYGKVEVFGKDSIRLSAVDANGTEVVAHTFMSEKQDSSGVGLNPAVKKSKLFSVYPNPTSGKLHIKASLKNETYTFTLMDIAGKLVATAIFQNETIKDLSYLEQGNYLYTITSENQQIVETGKVTLQSKN